MTEREQHELRVLQSVIAEGKARYGELAPDRIDLLAEQHAADLRAAGAPDLADRFVAAYEGLNAWTTPKQGEAALEAFQRATTEARLWLLNR